MKRKILRVPEQVYQQLTMTAALAGVDESTVMEAAFAYFASLDMEMKRQAVRAWWAERSAQPAKPRGLCAMVRNRLAALREWFDRDRGSDARAA